MCNINTLSATDTEIVVDIDGNRYSTVTIGTQIWTIDNLRTTRLNDGTTIPHVPAAFWDKQTGPSYFFYDNNYCPAFQSKWGALYNWYTIGTGKLAPPGWRVPNERDWDTLKNYLGPTYGNRIGKPLATNTDWYTSPESGTPGHNPSSNNDSRFGGLPGASVGFGSSIGFSGLWWSSLDCDTTDALYFMLGYNDYSLRNGFGSKMYGFSIRLIKG